MRALAGAVALRSRQCDRTAFPDSRFGLAVCTDEVWARGGTAFASLAREKRRIDPPPRRVLLRRDLSRARAPAQRVVRDGRYPVCQPGFGAGIRHGTQ